MSPVLRWQFQKPLALVSFAALLGGVASPAVAGEGPVASPPETPSLEQGAGAALDGKNLKSTSASPGNDGVAPPPNKGVGDAPGANDAANLELTPGKESKPTTPLAKAPVADKSGGSSQAMSIPGGAAKIEGMGESFSMQLSTGVATFSVPIKIPRPRGSVAATLNLAYSSSSGHAVAGVGWDVSVPSISRQGDRGTPTYDDQATWHPNQDRFVFNGGQELVPICVVTNGLGCAGKIAGEVMPSFSKGWMYFRPRVEGSFQRFFLSPDKKTWIVQDKSGGTMEFGVARDLPTDENGLERNPDAPSQIFRWHVVRQYDAQRAPDGSPVNWVVYRYDQGDDGGVKYLTDVFDTSPATNPSDTADLHAWAHHVHLVYEQRPDATFSYKRGWRTGASLRLKRVDVSVRESGDLERQLVRRFHLAYDSAYHASLLAQVQIEGRCPGPIFESLGLVPDGTTCPRLPAMKFSYTHVSPDGMPGDLPGYEAFDSTVRGFATSPDHSVDEDQTDLIDVNGDGLPDVVVAMPGLYPGACQGPNGCHGLYLNGLDATHQRGFKQTGMCVVDAPGTLPTNVDAGILTFKNSNVAPLDADGDGIVDLLHMPQAKTYTVHRPESTPSGLCWVGRTVATATQQSPKIDFTKEAGRTRVLDVNGDGLVDVVYTSGTEVQTFLGLGRYPSGDGQFGTAKLLSNSTAEISNDPIVACLPYSGSTVRFGDDDVKLADMNGDGLTDIVRVRKGDVRYWPGRGNGFWGTGDRNDCLKAGFAEDRFIAMDDSPQFPNPEPAEIRLDDVNGDGLDDIVNVRFNAVDVWLNVDGVAWTKDRHTFSGTPKAPEGKGRVRLVDINGSGTRDIVWGEGYNYQYVDLQAGTRPWMLSKVENGLGKTTVLEYTTSTEEMLAAETAGSPWSTKMPTVAQVVKRQRETLASALGRPAEEHVTEYVYRDPVYEGRQREFRGFRSTVARSIGDGSGPTSESVNEFLLGECQDETSNGVDDCAVGERWRDNRREALKGLPVVVHQRAESVGGAPPIYESTQHHRYLLRNLYTGLDGRVVRHVVDAQTDKWLYDAGNFVAADQVVNVTDVAGIAPSLSRQLTLPSKARRVQLRSERTVDKFGNETESVGSGCIAGCTPADEVIRAVTVHTLLPHPSGWLWRATEAHVEGASGAKRNHSRTTYDALGNQTLVEAELLGSLPLDRFHETTGATVAPSPVNAAADGWILTSHESRDVFGNVLLTKAAGGRCGGNGYAVDYADIPVLQLTYVGALGANGCGTTAITSSAIPDRGLSVLREAVDAHGQITRATYDAFGRTTSINHPRANPTTVGEASGAAHVLMEYRLPDVTGKPYTVIQTRIQDGPNEDAPSYLDSWRYVDGAGRTIAVLTEADPTAGDGGSLVASELATYNAKGAAFETFEPFFIDADGFAGPTVYTPGLDRRQQFYDAFGRPTRSLGLDGLVTTANVYHALSTDTYDAGDYYAGTGFTNTYVTLTRDGHNRPILVTERIRDPQLETRRVQTTYLPTGEVSSIKRVRDATGETVIRWMRHDSLGRMVLNVEPSTSVGYSPNPNADIDSIKAWRYAYDAFGALVGTSDARGCGVNYHYDAGGRMLAEDYSPCAPNHAPYSAPDLETGDGTEVFIQYDVPPAESGGCFVDPRFTLGRETSRFDRAARSLTGVDGRGRTACAARSVAAPGPVPDDLSARYTARWYVKDMTYDGADRPVRESTGATLPSLLGVDPSTPSATPSSYVTTEYSRRGNIRRVSGSYGILFQIVNRRADGLVAQAQYGDVAGTTTATTYDVRRRVERKTTFRSKPNLWNATSNYSPPPAPNGPPTSFQILLEDTEVEYDAVDNPKKIYDWRTPAEWPQGAKPAHRTIQYDDLYRVKKITWTHRGGDGWTDPFAFEDGGGVHPRQADPAPHIAFNKRVKSQSFTYDWLGNTVSTDDDSQGFYDRSLGSVQNSVYRLTAASNANGSLQAAYDGGGNMRGLSVTRGGGCLPAGAVCSQRFVYDWDEVGRLVRARRWDTSSPGSPAAAPPNSSPAVDVAYAYDGTDSRVRKSTGNSHSLFVFPTYEVRRTEFVANEYSENEDCAAVRLMAGQVTVAELALEPASTPTLPGAGRLHVLLEITDTLQSVGALVDKATGELVEANTYLAYGQADADYRPARWQGYRSNYRFTGKEEDVEVGLVYFGKRFWNPNLGRWVSPDPLTVHALGADLNVYAYVKGRLLKSVDPKGLAEEDASEDLEQGRLFEGMRLVFQEGDLSTALKVWLFVEPPGRKLTKTECEDARLIFGDSIDYDRVRIKPSNGDRDVGRNRMMTDAGTSTIWVDPALYKNTSFSFVGNSLSDNDITARSTLVHELTHVWQQQRGNTGLRAGGYTDWYTPSAGVEFQRTMSFAQALSSDAADDEAEMVRFAFLYIKKATGDKRTVQGTPELSDSDNRKNLQEVLVGLQR